MGEALYSARAAPGVYTLLVDEQRRACVEAMEDAGWQLLAPEDGTGGAVVGSFVSPSGQVLIYADPANPHAPGRRFRIVDDESGEEAWVSEMPSPAEAMRTVRQQRRP